MPRDKKEPIRCPKCGAETGISFNVFVQLASIKIPVKEGELAPSYELCLEDLVSSDGALIRYSDSKGNTRIALYPEEMDTVIDCPKCSTVSNVPEEMSIKCNDVE